MCEIPNDIPIIKTFIHKNKYYFYDTFTNRLLYVSKEQFSEILLLQKVGHKKYTQFNKNTQEYNDVLQLIQSGFLHKMFIKEIKHKETDLIPFILDRSISTITLQVTRGCNFKCRYCSYAAENGIDRDHENINMSFDIAKQTVDFLYDHSQDSNEIFISFYGGEPLLNIELIEHIVNYTNNKFFLKNINYQMTTNGSLLTEKISNFLIKNNFMLAISMDGYETIQNKHRKFYNNGDDTFNEVFRNILFLKDFNNEYFYRNVYFIPVLFSDESRDEVMSFFIKNGIKEYQIDIHNASTNGIDYLISQTTINLSYNNRVILTQEAKKLYTDKLNNKYIIPEIWQPGGFCIPGSIKLYVNVHGDFYPCEKTLEVPQMGIGNINSGIDIHKVIRLANLGELTENECKHCWVMRFCSVCAMYCIDIEKNEVNAKQKLEYCHQQKKLLESYFMEELEKINFEIEANTNE